MMLDMLKFPMKSHILIDKSDKTNSVTLEILGMETSFQKTFSDSEFIEIVEAELTIKCL